MISHYSPYDLVADEYYDCEAHPTCANFRELGVKFLMSLGESEFSNFIGRDSTFVETGSGKSTVLEAFPNFVELHEKLVLQDDSEKMLRHSLKWQNSIKELLVCDARRMPFDDKEISGTFSFLADPYHDERLWDEIARVTVAGGFWLTTLPSHSWATKFRSKNGRRKSRFVTRAGKDVDLPSQTYPPSKVIGALERRGFSLARYQSLALNDLSGPISDKLKGRDSDSSVIDCYIFQKA